MKFHRIAIAALAFCSAQSFAQSKPEDQIRMRQGAYQLLARNVSMLNAMAKGDMPYNKDLALQRAEFLATLVPQIWTGFTPGSDKGLANKSDPKIWADAEGFKAAQEKLSAATKALPSAAGDVNTLKAAMGAVLGSCKNCHDNFRSTSYHE